MTRRTYHYDEKLGKMVEGPGPRRVDGSGDGWRFSDRSYSGTPFKAPDGTIIDSRKKHRDYMRRTGLATADDFKGVWAKAKQEREAFYEGRSQSHAREVREDLRRAVEKCSSR
jgi:hypothetical protein